jgi:lipopolysaccharide assembly outer membrane protein LptD (OstA)
MPFMKRFFVALIVCTLALTAQNQPAAQLKHLSVPTTTNANPISVAALDIEREGLYPAIIHLKGSVEIKTPVCVKAGRDGALNCDGYVVLHADQADFHEDSGQIEARGNVKVTREQ